MSTKTNTFISYRGGVSITASGGSAVVLKEVTNIDEINAETLEPWQADGTLFATQQARVSAGRGLTIYSGDVATMKLITRGVPCTIVATLYDSINGVGTGAITETWINAVVADVPSSGPTNKFAGGSISFMCYSSDGTTDPYSFTQAS